jgi:hypothetical protein
MTIARSLKAALGALSLALVLGVPSRARAAEPGDNAPPWNPGSALYHGDVSVYTVAASGAEFGNAAAITTTTDVDYSLVVCGGFTDGANNLVTTVKSIEVKLAAGAGDLDMDVYTTDGTFLGRSNGTGAVEIVDVSARKRGAVVLKVYGWAGAKGTYTVYEHCQ